jgi:hypothetical protein
MFVEPLMVECFIDAASDNDVKDLVKAAKKLTQVARTNDKGVV